MIPTVTTHAREVVNLEKTIGYVFTSRELLDQALTHSSQAREAETLRPAGAERAADNEPMSS